MKTIKCDYDELCRTIRDKIPGEGKWLIGIDGVKTSGKTHLGKKLVSDLGDAKHVDLDHHLKKDQGTIGGSLQVEELREALTGKETENQVIVFSSVLLLQVLKRLGIEQNFMIYVRRMSSAGLGLDYELFDDSVTEDEAIDEARLQQKIEIEFLIEQGCLKETADVPEDCLNFETIRYHKRVRPQCRADIVFERTVD